jgi:hypothetical protein
VADADQTDRHTQERAASTVDFALGVYHQATPEEQKAVLDKAAKAAQEPEELEKLTPDEIQVLQNLRERQLKFFKHEKNLEHFTSDPIDGFIPNLVRGSLGLTTRIKSESTNGSKEPEILDFLKMNGSKQQVV